MHIFSRKSTNKGFGVKGKKVSGGGLRLNRAMRLKTKGNGLSEEYFKSAQNESEPLKPDFVKKFKGVRIKNSKPKEYITF